MKKIVFLFYDRKHKLKVDDYELPIEEETNFKEFENEVNLLRKFYDITFLSNHEKSIKYFYKNKKNIDLVVNLADNGYNNDLDKNGLFIELFNFLGIKYTGRQANNMEFFEKKDLIFYVLDYLGIEIPKTMVFYPGMDFQFLEQKLSYLKYPLIVKLGKSGGSLTLDNNSICFSLDSIKKKIKEIEKFLGKQNVLILQEFIENAKEYSTFIIGNQECNDIKAFTIKVTPKKFYDYEQKMISQLPSEEFYKKCDLEDTILKEVEHKLVYVKNVTACMDYVRIDWLLDGFNRIYLIDFNANPAFDSELTKTINKLFPIKENLLDYVINSALNR